MKALKIISDILPIPGYSIIIICFFLPFFTIKCGSTDLVTISGFDYILMEDAKSKMKDSPFAKELEKKMGAESLFGTDTEVEKQDSTDAFADEYNETINENATNSDESKRAETPLPPDTPDEKKAKILFFIMMVIPFLLAISGLAVSFTKIKNKTVLNIVFASIGFIILVAYGLIIKASNNELTAMASAAESFGGMFSIQLGTAYYVATILFLLLLIFFSVEKYIRKTYFEEQQLMQNPDEYSSLGEEQL